MLKVSGIENKNTEETDKNRCIAVLLMAVLVSIAIHEFSIANCDAIPLILSLGRS
jgi:hypothetical protein